MSVNSKRLGGCLIAAAALSLAPLPSAAEASASASLSGFGWTLIDLDPNDGVVPELSIRNPSVATWSQRIDGPAPTVDWKSGFNSTQVVNLTGSARTQLTPSDAHAWAEASNDTSEFLAYNSRSFLFDITPRTAIEFYGQAEVNSSKPGSGRTYGRVEMQGALYDTVVRPLPPDAVPISSLLLALDTARGGESQWLTGRLSSGDGAASGSFQLYSRAGVNLVPVPEPSTWAMLLAGLGLAGWRARRTLP